MSFLGERWKPVNGFEGIYEISSNGQVKGPLRILSGYKTKTGYVQVDLYNKGKRSKRYVHVLVLKAFRGEPLLGEECNHKNGKKWDNRLTNLEWTTRSNNHLHRYHILGQKAVSGEDHFYHGKFGSKNPSSKAYIVTNPLGLEIRIIGLQTFCITNNLDTGTMSNIARGRYGCRSHKGWKCRYA